MSDLSLFCVAGYAIAVKIILVATGPSDLAVVAALAGLVALTIHCRARDRAEGRA